MNKKFVVMVASIALGALLLTTTVFAGLSGTSGYDTYKTALKTTIAAESATAQVEVTVKDNGAVLETFQIDSKVDVTNQSMSSNVNMGDDAVEFFMNDGQFVIKSSDSDAYKVRQSEDGTNPHQDLDMSAMMDSDHVQKMESVLDALSTGFLKYVSTTNNIDGSKQVAINLNGSQVPQTLNAMIAVASTNMDRDMEAKTEHFGNMPKLVSGITVEGINVNAQISKDNLLTEQNQSVVISGIDADGIQHKVELAVKISFSDYNNTQTEKVDLSGKQVQVLEPIERSHR